MRRTMLAWLACGLCFVAGANARAATSARMVATDPPGADVTLAAQQPFYLRIAYTTDTPVSIRARPYLHGTEVPATTNASVPHAGSGEALGWFAFIEPGEVDEIRIEVGDPAQRFGREIARYPVHIVGSGQRAARADAAPWVGRLQREDAQAWKQQLAAGGAAAGGGGLLMLVVAMAVPLLLIGGFAAPAWALWRWRGGWRLAAAAPAALMAFVALRFVLDTARDPTSHNLWPFEVLIHGAISVGCVAVLLFARRLLRVEG